MQIGFFAISRFYDLTSEFTYRVQLCLMKCVFKQPIYTKEKLLSAKPSE